MLGSKPSDLIPYFDASRFAECLVDSKEPVPYGPTLLDANVRAIQLVRAAEGRICQATRVKNQYSLQQLRDLVLDAQTGGVMGQQLMWLIADVAWCATVGRKRYSADSPQAKDPACESAEKYLEMLQSGEKIFVLDGVPVHDGDGNLTGDVYGPDVSEVGVLEGSRLHSNIDCAHRFWGNTNQSVCLGTGTFCDDAERRGCP